MTPHPFEAAFHRVARAQEHLADLRQMFAVMEREKKNTALSHIQTEGLEYLLSGGKLRVEFPIVTAIRIGECLYNVRTALDYMVFKLTKTHAVQTKNFTNFPIINAPDKFKAWRKHALSSGIDCAHIAALKGLQPYKGCDWTRSLGRLSNIDKHREFAPLNGSTTITFYCAVEDANFMEIVSPIFRAKHPTIGVEMDMKFDITPPISFDEGTPVIETLEKICCGAIETLKAFDPNL